MSKENPRLPWNQWDRLRQSVIRRDNYLCQSCKLNGRITPGRDVDHIIALANGGSNELENLQTLCKPCHDDKTRADLGHKLKPVIGVDGWPLG